MLRAATLIALVAIFATGTTHAAPIFSTDGSAVVNVDRSATFPNLGTGFDLSNYSEGGLFVTVPDTSFVGFDPFGNGTTSGFHYGSGGNNAFVSIRGTDDAILRGVEFRFGSGFGLGLVAHQLLWQTLLNGVITGGAVEVVNRNTIVGFRDSVAGFDELRVAAFTPTDQAVFGNFQAIALDDVVVELPQPVDPVAPEPTSLALMTLGGLGLLGGRRRAAARRSS